MSSPETGGYRSLEALNQTTEGLELYGVREIFAALNSAELDGLKPRNFGARIGEMIAEAHVALAEFGITTSDPAYISARLSIAQQARQNDLPETDQASVISTDFPLAVPDGDHFDLESQLVEFTDLGVGYKTSSQLSPLEAFIKVKSIREDSSYKIWLNDVYALESPDSHDQKIEDQIKYFFPEIYQQVVSAFDSSSDSLEALKSLDLDLSQPSDKHGYQLLDNLSQFIFSKMGFQPGVEQRIRLRSDASLHTLVKTDSGLKLYDLTANKLPLVAVPQTVNLLPDATSSKSYNGTISPALVFAISSQKGQGVNPLIIPPNSIDSIYPSRSKPMFAYYVPNVVDPLQLPDAEALRKTAHSLKGSSSNVCALQLSELARQLEQIGKQGSTEGALDIYQAIKQEFAAVIKILKNDT